jgi:3-hydroxybutyryl-CoA dehydratase
MMIEAGLTLTWVRTFTRDDVESFARISGDAGRQHVTPDEEGRVMVHGLLTATLPTKLGGDMNFIAKDMTFEFVRPVFCGDTVRCSVCLVEAAHEARRTRVRVEGSCTNQLGHEVLRFRSNGVILDEPG